MLVYYFNILLNARKSGINFTKFRKIISLMILEIEKINDLRDSDKDLLSNVCLSCVNPPNLLEKSDNLESQVIVFQDYK